MASLLCRVFAVFTVLSQCLSSGKGHESSKCTLGFVGHNGSCYYFSHIKTTFWGAERICRYFDGYLAQVTSKAEDDFIRNFAIRHGKASTYWLGGTDLRVEGTWTWEHQMRELTYSNWYPREPDNGQGGKEHCLEIRKDMTYMWNDNVCNESGNFICEHDKSNNTMVMIVDALDKQQKKTEDELKDHLVLSKSSFENQIEELKEIKSELIELKKAKSQMSGQIKSIEEQIQQMNASSKEEPEILEDCSAIKKKKPNSVDGIYRVKPMDGGSFQVYCDMSKQGGGWVVIQRRYRGAEDFDRTWNEYKEGFGLLTGEFWLGNEKIHRLTEPKRYQLRMDLEMEKGTKERYALYDSFSVSGESKFYTLHVGGYSGTTNDVMAYHNNVPFSAKDKDLDKSSGNCAVAYKGAWWYNLCYHVNLNGASGYFDLRTLGNIRASTMKIRPLL